jgi:hypothetical protein
VYLTDAPSSLVADALNFVARTVSLPTRWFAFFAPSGRPARWAMTLIPYP